MDVAINDLSFNKRFSSKEEAVKKVHQWMEICKRIESGEATAVEKLYSDDINTSAEIAPDFPLIQLIKEFQTQDERRYLIHLLANLEKPKCRQVRPFLLEEACSYICAWAKEGFLISLETDSVFEKPRLDGMIDSDNVSIKNISCQEHIRLYENWLGIRHYELNKKHRIKPYIDAAGREVSAMDLNDLEAQKLLNQAVEINGNLYGKRHGQYYSFQKHHDNYFHCYQNNDLAENIINKINEKKWE